ncbi:UDP-N-acetylglucosamine--N-acetylmuramyl-(pentapeptide) pyrophosphoryl-undecaprenol N-acetylglucosamine transferase [Candidatus Parcubacteria bacterium]|nr:MAG: UDP-N-acetylglucosamine--N-acetylmuramyl-(pentapeptide) pyrophosphoryl-undecaprenol N-acetylglucosamine transferase [Candidatus Parcubacteria bacterium]
MKIAFTGGGSGGHFYPIIAVAEAIREIATREHLIQPELYYLAPEPFDARLLYEFDIHFEKIPAGKVRRYPSIANLFDPIKTFSGTLRALKMLYRIFPDVVFSKGGYASVPVVTAAHVLRIPIVIHDSDAIPGRANLLARKWAERIAITYPESLPYLEDVKDKVALVGHPVRRSMLLPPKDNGRALFGIENADMPVVVFLTGSLGAQAINDVVLKSLPELVEHFFVIHQTGKAHIQSVEQTAKVILRGNPKAHRYQAHGFLGDAAMRAAMGAASVVVSRAGSGTIAELACSGAPTILVPIPEEVSRDQRKNAYAYARLGAASVIEQGNLTPHVLVAELEKVVSDKALRKEMASNARTFCRPDAAEVLARELLRFGITHEAPAS